LILLMMMRATHCSITKYTLLVETGGSTVNIVNG
jgi:hypothetical protein